LTETLVCALGWLKYSLLSPTDVNTDIRIQSCWGQVEHAELSRCSPSDGAPQQVCTRQASALMSRIYLGLQPQSVSTTDAVEYHHREK